jgi:hypothetical protein
MTILHRAAVSVRPFGLRQLGDTRAVALPPPRRRTPACVARCGTAEGLVVNPFLSPWLCGADAWMGAAGILSPTEVLLEQMRIARDVTAHAFRFWVGAWTWPAPVGQPSLAERMAARSLRVVEGGRR